MLCPARMSHRDKFIYSIEEQLKTSNIEQDLINMENNLLNHEMEQVDMLITRTANPERKKMEGMRHNVPCSKEK